MTVKGRVIASGEQRSRRLRRNWLLYEAEAVFEGVSYTA